jgi:hypothetical protein
MEWFQMAQSTTAMAEIEDALVLAPTEGEVGWKA